MKFETRFETLKIADIIPSPYNPRIDIEPGSDEYKRLARSLQEHGVVEPPVVNIRNMHCVGGNQRLVVMKDLGYEEVLCSVIDQPDMKKEKKLCLALNRIDGRWDEDKLEELLRDDEVIKFEVGFDEEELKSYRLLEEMEDPDRFDGDGDEDDGYEDPDGDGEESDGDDSGDDDGEPYASDIMVRLGRLHFRVAHARYKGMLDNIRDEGIFDKDEIAKEIKRRLLHND